MKSIAVALMFLVFASAAWRYRQDIGSLLTYNTVPAKPFVFDNGSVRDAFKAPSPAGASNSPAIAHGNLRKCVRGSETTYTNFACPAGFKEKVVASDRVTVLEGQGTAQPSPSGMAVERKPSLRDALDLSQDSNLKERVIDRAVDPSPRQK